MPLAETVRRDGLRQGQPEGLRSSLLGINRFGEIFTYVILLLFASLEMVTGASIAARLGSGEPVRLCEESPTWSSTVRSLY